MQCRRRGGLFEEEAVEVVAVDVDQQRQNQEQTYVLRHFQHFVAHLAARNHLPQREDGMSAVEPRDGDDVHHRQDDRQEGRLEPEVVPVPRGGEDAADREESADFLVEFGFRLHDQLELLPIGGQRAPSLAESRRDRLPEGVVARARSVGGGCQYAQTALVAYGKRQFQRVGAAQHLDAYFLPGMELQLCLVVEEFQIAVAVHGDDLVAFLQARRCDDAVHKERFAQAEQILVALFLPHGDKGFEREFEHHFLAAAFDNHGAAVFVDKQSVEQRHRVVDGLAVHRYEPVAVLEAQAVARLVEGVAPAGIVVGEVGVAPRIADSAVDDDGQQDVHHHAGDHHQKALPGRFGPELPRLHGLAPEILVHRLVDHAGDLHVAAQRQPADAVFGVAALELEEREPRVEEDVELLDADAENPRHEEVPQLVDAHEDGETEEELDDFDEKFHDRRGCRGNALQTEVFGRQPARLGVRRGVVVERGLRGEPGV